jgi:hypothetical protein
MAAFKGNIYQKHECTPIVLPHHYKNTYIQGGYLTIIVSVCVVIDTACMMFVFEN